VSFLGLQKAIFSIRGHCPGPFFTFMKKVVYFCRGLCYNNHVSNNMTATYYASEVSPEEYSATLAEAAELALANYEAHISEQDVRIGDIIKDNNFAGDITLYRVTDIIQEQWYEPLIVLEVLKHSGWSPTSVRFHHLFKPTKVKPRKLRWFLSAIPVGGLFKSSNYEGALLMQRVQDTDAGTLRARYLEGQFTGEVICKSKHSRVYAL
jgi:hypothetical protein